MTRKISIRIEENLYNRLKAEYRAFGYRSLSAYIQRLLKQRKVVEISGGDELACVMHQIRTLTDGDMRLADRRDRLCRLYVLLMTEIENLRSCAESLNMQNETEECQSSI